MSKYTISDIKEADRLYDRMPLREVSERTGIPYGTISSWSRKDWITTERNYLAGPREYDWETVERADALYDRMPLTSVSDLLDIPLPTLWEWATRGWVSTEVNWKAKANVGKRKASPQRAAQLVKVKGYTQAQAAKELGVSQSTVHRYLKDYQKGRKSHAR